MTSTAQREQLHRTIWSMADQVRGAVEGWDFKQFVLGMLFYRFLSENFTAYIEGDDESADYSTLAEEMLTTEIIDIATKEKGYFIYPRQLFCNVVKTAVRNENLNIELAEIFRAIEASAGGYESEKNIRGLFADFDTSSSRLGATVGERNKRLVAIMQGVASLDLGDFHEQEIDLFGDAYEFLISNYASSAGKSGGEFFTPQQVSKLLASIAIDGLKQVNKVYDPACGSGSLLLQVQKLLGDKGIDEGFFGQEINLTTYNLARMNMFLHNVNYNKFDIQLGDTLLHPMLQEKRPFDVVVSNPPYSTKWIGSDDPTLINDERFAPAAVLAPRSKADFAFILHALHYLSARGRAAIVCFPGILYRGGAEKTIRKYLVDHNYVETVIALPANLFFGTSIAVNILVLSKHKADTAIQFIDASSEDFFKKVSKNNLLTDEHIDKIMALFRAKENVAHRVHLASLNEIREQDYNLSVTTYVEAPDTREVIDITALNAEVAERVARIDQLRHDINTLIAEIEG